MFSPINWKMIAHPINWIEILLMLIIAAAIGHTLLSYFKIEPKTSSYADVSPGLVSGQAASSAPLPRSV